MELENVAMRCCKVRAVMVYQGATISLQNCSIAHTDDPTTPTIHAQGPMEKEDDGNNVQDDKPAAIPQTSKGNIVSTANEGPSPTGGLAQDDQRHHQQLS